VKSILTIEDISHEISSGVACALSKAVKDGILHLRPFSITSNGQLTTANAPRIPKEIVPTPKMYLEVGDILFNNTNSVELVGKSAVLHSQLEATFSNHLTRVRINRQYAEPGYVHAFFCHLYRHNFFQDKATRWVGQAAFGSSQLKALEVPLPPLDEQRRIVGLLNRASELRYRAETARAKARAIIPALFFDTFGDPVTNHKRWKTSPIKEIAQIMGGGTPSKANPTFWNGTIPWVSPKDMKPSTIESSEDQITDTAIAESSVKIVPIGSVLIVVRGMILAHTVPIRVNSVPVTINQDMKAIVPNKNVDATFIRWALQVSHDFLLSKVRESAHGTKKLETTTLAEYLLINPPIEIQTAFANRAEHLEAFASSLDIAAQKSETLAASLSAEVFK